MPTLETLITDLRRLGVRPGQRLIVHSALRKVGPIDGGAETMIQALRAALDERGTLLFPNLNIPHEFTAANPPRFDLQHGSVRERLGVLAQVFKEHHAREFSRHPTHGMMGVGPDCAALFTGHETAGLPCGPGTPWWRLGQEGGSILLLGVTQQNNTSIHGTEEKLANYQLSTEPVDGIVIDRGEEMHVASRLHRWGNRSDFTRIDPWLEKAGGLRRGKIGHADSLLVDASIFQAQLVERLTVHPRFLLLD